MYEIPLVGKTKARYSGAKSSEPPKTCESLSLYMQNNTKSKIWIKPVAEGLLSGPLAFVNVQSCQVLWAEMGVEVEARVLRALNVKTGPVWLWDWQQKKGNPCGWKSPFWVSDSQG